MHGGPRNFSILLIFATSPAHDETNIAARNHRVRQSMFRKTHAAATRSIFEPAENIAVSKRAPSTHRSGMRGAARMQRASRNLQSSLPHLAARTGSSEDRHWEAPTIPRDYIRRSSLAALSRAGFWRDNRARIRVAQFQKLRQCAPLAEMCESHGYRSYAGHQSASGAPPRSGEYAPPVSWMNK